MKNKAVGAALAVALFSLSAAFAAEAATITINNASFESPYTTGATYDGVPGWSLEGTGGVWNINSDPTLSGCPGPCWGVPAPDGAQIAWLSVGGQSGGPSTLSQTLTHVIQANRPYTLTGSFGHPNHFQNSPQGNTLFTAELWATNGIAPLAIFQSNGPAASFSTFTLSYFSGNDAAVGESLQIRLRSNQAQTGVDDLAVNLPDGGVTLALLGGAMLGLGVLRRKFGV